MKIGIIDLGAVKQVPGHAFTNKGHEVMPGTQLCGKQKL